MLVLIDVGEKGKWQSSLALAPELKVQSKQLNGIPPINSVEIDSMIKTYQR